MCRNGGGQQNEHSQREGTDLDGGLLKLVKRYLKSKCL